MLSCLGRRRKQLLTALALMSLIAFIFRLETNMISLQLPKLVSPAMQDEKRALGKTKTNATTTTNEGHHNDWFLDESWHNNYFTQQCLHVDNICHSAYRWFYDPRSSSDRAHQPPFIFSAYEVDSTTERLFNFMHHETSTHFLGRPRKIFVQAPPHRRRHDIKYKNVLLQDDDGEMFDNFTSSSEFLKTCKYSPIPNHMVLQSYYNDMLGEFYTRSLVYLHSIYSAVLNRENFGNYSYRERNASDHHEQQDLDFESLFLEQTQMYLHVKNFPEYNKLLDSHHVFTDAFRSNAMLSFTYLVDYTGCRCLKRLHLCGYEHGSLNEQNQRQRGTFADDSDENITELIAAGESGPEFMLDFHPHIASDLRDQLQRSVIHKNPFIQKEIAKFRYDAIRRHKPRQTASLNIEEMKKFLPLDKLRQRRQQVLREVEQFRIVGLTQRIGRRRWLHMDQLIEKCNTEWFNESDKIVCVEVNLEKPEVNPVRQVVMHAACDMIFGIHGAQLTEAVWMKDNSVVVELLPYIDKEDGYGSWTRQTHVPTPLGVMFSECSLNHIGYRLPRESAPYCLNISNSSELDQCWSSEIAWGDRDYQVNPDTLQDMIRKFAPQLGERTDTNVTLPESCEEMLERAGDRVYVLYNVLCVDSNQTQGGTLPANRSVHHFYWKLDTNST